MEDITKQVADLLKKSRTTKYKSARSFATKHGIPISTYSQHETGKRGVNLDVLSHYCYCLNIDFFSLLQQIELNSKEELLIQPQQSKSVFTNYLTPRDINVPKESLSTVIREGVSKFLHHQNVDQMEAFIEHCTSNYFATENKKTSVENSVDHSRPTTYNHQSEYNQQADDS